MWRRFGEFDALKSDQATLREHLGLITTWAYKQLAEHNSRLADIRQTQVPWSVEQCRNDFREALTAVDKDLELINIRLESLEPRSCRIP